VRRAPPPLRADGRLRHARGRNSMHGFQEMSGKARLLVGGAASALGLVFVCGPALAQDSLTGVSENQSAETAIIVTGSRIKRVGTHETTPVTVIDADLKKNLD